MAPTGLENQLACRLEGYVGRLSAHGGCGKLAVGIEHRNEAAGHHVKYLLLHVAEVLWRNTSRDDGVVVSHLRRVKHLLALQQLGPAQGHEQFAVERGDAVEDGAAFRIDVVRQVGRVDTWVGGDLLLVERLDELQGEVGREAEFLVAVHLQRCQVIQAGRHLRALLLLDRGHGEGFGADAFECGAPLLFGGEPAFGRDVPFGLVGLATLLSGRCFRLRSLVGIGVGHDGVEERVAVAGGQHPVRFRLEMVYLVLAFHDEGQRRRLHPSDAERLATLFAVAVFQCVQACGVHAQQPVTDGATESGFIERLVFLLRMQGLESFADALFGERRNPQPVNGTLGTRLLHDPTLDQFALLSRIAAVHDALGLAHELFDHGKLLPDTAVLFQADAKALRNHGQRAQAPPFPERGVVFGIFQFTQVAVGPGHLVTVAFKVACVAGVRSQYDGYFLCHTGLFCNANYHGGECCDSGK